MEYSLFALLCNADSSASGGSVLVVILAIGTLVVILVVWYLCKGKGENYKILGFAYRITNYCILKLYVTLTVNSAAL